MRVLVVFLSAIWVAMLLSSCGATKNKPNVELIQDMMLQPALKSQDFLPNQLEKGSVRTPPRGSWPRNVTPYLYGRKPIEAGEKLKNPHRLSESSEFLERGRRHYNNFCAVCHGREGKGDGLVASKFVVGRKPPSLLTDLIKGYPDGRIFHIITEGQGLMGAYIYQLPKIDDRWAVVNYIRSLQKKVYE